ncbi:UNKNOWN [Stylonychia lemnae]|uniref:Serine hydrolase domain-containing protein n=1 Tax=Stylonychia lemnae TaxID=5949 RepID=A0A077ZP62_STYLE|nr:UNKNOWN [Stylonychia lemnae]|eukprot:CDW71752.1 UNKNOWN [Stylonychia lemnae]
MIKSIVKTQFKHFSTLQQKQPKKLRILSLHGYNNTKEIAEYQSKQFRKVFENVADFSFIDAPYFITNDSPHKALLSLGFQPPFRSWFQLRKVEAELQQNMINNKYNEVFGVEKSINLIVEEINQKGPFDGFMTFSQGSLMFRYFYRVAMDIAIHEQLVKIEEMPKFLISIGGVFFSDKKVNYKDQKFKQDDYIFPIDSIHINGIKDEFMDILNESGQFQNPIVINHQGGHSFPKKMVDKDFQQMLQFMKKQYERKFQSLNNFNIDYDSLDFVVKE